MQIFTAIAISASLLAVPAKAGWRAVNPVAAEAVKEPRIAAALAAAMRMDTAILTRDAAEFAAVFTEDAVVNNPFNRIARKPDALRNLGTGLIDYTSIERSVEYAATRGTHDIVLMGEELLTPVGKARFPGKTVKRRTTEIWTDADGGWKLAVRQATIYSVE